MFTTSNFWAGVICGGVVVAAVLYHWLVKPMAKLLGLEKD